MSKPEILLLGPFPDHDFAAMDAEFNLHAYYEAKDQTAFLDSVGPKIRGIATRGGIGASAQVISACPQLEIVSVYGVGYDAVDLKSCRARGIPVTNTPDVLTKDVADLGVGMMLALGRNIPKAQDWVRSGQWAQSGGFALQRRIWGARAGILGLGRIGMEVARRLQGFEMDISYSDLAQKDTPWRYVANPVELAAGCDILFVTLAASAATKHIVGPQVITALGPTGMLINISRSSNIDESALLASLEAGTLGAAALDVFDNEPRLNPRFLELDNVLLQPHHASGTHETRADMGALMRANLTAHFAGEPLPTPVP